MNFEVNLLILGLDHKMAGHSRQLGRPWLLHWLALIRRAWVTDFPLTGSDGAESLGKRSILGLW